MGDVEKALPEFIAERELKVTLPDGREQKLSAPAVIIATGSESLLRTSTCQESTRIPFLSLFLTVSSTSEQCIKAFVGIHPRFRQVPPA